jgi:hypothetical protein
MTNSTSTKILRAALFTLVPLAYLSMYFWQPVSMSWSPRYSHVLQWLCIILMTAVFSLSLYFRRTYRLVAVFGFLACFLWLLAFMLPVI